MLGAFAIDPRLRADENAITSVAAVRSLAPEEAARTRPVRITGIVTRCTRDEVFLQDGTDAIFVWPDHARALYQPGDLIEVVGTTGEGHFLPVVTEISSRLLGRRELPPPLRATYADLASGRLDCCWVEVIGAIRSAEHSSRGNAVCRLAMDADVLRVEIAESANRASPRRVGDVVRLRGVAGGLKNRQRQIIQPAVWVTASDETVSVLTSAPANLFATSSQPISTLMSYPDTSRPNPLSKVVGQVTWAESPTRLYVRDETNALEVHLQSPFAAQIGDQVELVGFAEHGTIKPLLIDAFARRAGVGPTPAPRPTTVRRLLRRDDEAELVQIEALIKEVSSTSQSITFTATEDNAVFDVVYSRQNAEALGELPRAGARVAFVGICKIDRMTSDLAQIASVAAFSLRLRSLEDIRLIAAPSWWTARRLAIVIGGLSAGLVVAGAWIGTLRRIVARQTEVIVAKTRTEATLEERDRIARELHDSLEQQLTGTTILLDAAASALHHRADSVGAHLATARAMLRHSLDEAQRAVQNLRSRELEDGDLATALEHSLQALVGFHAVTLCFEKVGERIELDAVAENHLLRVAQEATTNALKHAAPKTIHVLLRSDGEQVLLRVQDDGRGMDLSREGKGASAGAFGLIGMRERADKLRGHLKIVSAKDAGTLIELGFPSAPAKRRSTKSPSLPKTPAKSLSVILSGAKHP